MPEPRMSHAAAEAVTAEIRTVAGSIADNLTRLRGLVAHARDGGADVALGFRSWTEYLAEIVGTVRPVDREQRRAVAAYLADQGLSTRAIAPIVGVHHDTVASDLRSQLSESPTTERDVSIVVADAPDGQPVRLRVITGRDGKTYPRPAVPGPAAARAIAAPAPPSPSPSAPPSVSAPRSVSDYDFKRALLNLKAVARELKTLTTDPSFSTDRFARHGTAFTVAVESITAAVARFDVR